jgi:putative membrane protein
MIHPPPLPPFGITAVWRVLTSFATGPFPLAALAAEVCAGAWYLNGLAALRRRGRRWPRSRPVAFAFGLLAVAFALQTGVPLYANDVFTVHILQHLALMIAAPVGFALGAPVTLFMQTTTRPRKVAALRLLRSPVVRAATNPVVAGVLNYGVMFWFFLDHGIVLAMASAWRMDVVNLLFLLFGCLLWWPLLSVDYIGRRRYRPIVRLAIGIAGMPFDAILAISLLAGAARQSIAPKLYSLGSMHAGAAVFWILVMLLSGTALTVPIREWMASEDRQAHRCDLRLAEQAARRPGPGRRPDPAVESWWGAEVRLDEDGLMATPWSRDVPAARDRLAPRPPQRSRWRLADERSPAPRPPR